MANSNVRKIDNETLPNLRVLAQLSLSMEEEEVRQILKQAVPAPEWLGDLAIRLFNPTYDGEALNF